MEFAEPFNSPLGYAMLEGDFFVIIVTSESQPEDLGAFAVVLRSRHIK